MEIKFIVSFKWQKRSTKHPIRGLDDDGEAMDTKVRKTKAQKLINTFGVIVISPKKTVLIWPLFALR